jgi:adenosylcobinamide-GDP ribazoletransferase
VKGLRSAFTLLTILPVGPRQPLDLRERRNANATALWFPLVGLFVGLVGAVAIKLVRSWYQTWSVQLLPAILALALAALLTRGMHLDGLADVADGLGASREPERSLAVMRDPALGAFGVMTLVFVVLLQAACLERCIVSHRGTLSVTLAMTTGRVAMMLACREGVKPATESGLGALLIGKVRLLPAAAVALAVAVAGALGGKFDIDGGRDRLAVHAVLAFVAALLVAEGLRLWISRRLNGITGDVLGLINEAATLVVLLIMAGHIPTLIDRF